MKGILDLLYFMVTVASCAAILGMAVGKVTYWLRGGW